MKNDDDIVDVCKCKPNGIFFFLNMKDIEIISQQKILLNMFGLGRINKSHMLSLL